ncbi:small kinetochore-associated protein-like isoform X1 [Scyliorhinus canicula]|uniref:small kinetochore-associated protein-like isoform X1 n=2 Tax=Scyliorhinus canicula TaxID=7830 RepID=UPI0018F2B2B2|nr:small kinetochore-associated protein-like isoform X1 [Scyliorhinus canicula]
MVEYCLPEEMQRSRLPVYQPRRTLAGMPPLEAPIAKIFRTDRVLQPSMRNLPVKPMLPEFERDLPRAFNFSHKMSSSRAVMFEATSKPCKVALNKRKKVPSLSRMTRADMEKYMALKVVEAELRDQNQLLEAAQQQLKEELKLAKDQTNELMVKTESLQSEKEAMSKRLQNCIILLENNLIDPVSANKIIEDHELKNACQRDTMVHVENLQAELETWEKYTAEKREKLQEVKLKLQKTKDESNKIVEDTDLIQKELEEWRISLNQSKQLLELDLECSEPCN